MLILDKFLCEIAVKRRMEYCVILKRLSIYIYLMPVINVSINR